MNYLTRKLVKIVMSACVVEEGREEGGGACVEGGAGESGAGPGEQVERSRREILMSGRGRRACSEQGPHPSLHIRGEDSDRVMLYKTFTSKL